MVIKTEVEFLSLKHWPLGYKIKWDRLRTTNQFTALGRDGILGDVATFEEAASLVEETLIKFVE